LTTRAALLDFLQINAQRADVAAGPDTAFTVLHGARRIDRNAALRTALQKTASVESFWHNRNCVGITFKRMKYYQLLSSVETRNALFISKNCSCDGRLLTCA
jgi:hypothetical protein